MNRRKPRFGYAASVIGHRDLHQLAAIPNPNRQQSLTPNFRNPVHDGIFHDRLQDEPRAPERLDSRIFLNVYREPVA